MIISYLIGVVVFEKFTNVIENNNSFGSILILRTLDGEDNTINIE